MGQSIRRKFIATDKSLQAHAPSMSTVKKWAGEFKCDLTFLEDDPHEGRPKTELEIRMLCGKWVPHLLNADPKWIRQQYSEESLNWFNRIRLILWFVTAKSRRFSRDIWLKLLVYNPSSDQLGCSAPKSTLTITKRLESRLFRNLVDAPQHISEHLVRSPHTRLHRQEMVLSFVHRGSYWIPCHLPPF